MSKERSVRRNLYFPGDTYERVSALAAAANRSVSNYLVTLALSQSVLVARAKRNHPKDASSERKGE